MHTRPLYPESCTRDSECPGGDITVESLPNPCRAIPAPPTHSVLSRYDGIDRCGREEDGGNEWGRWQREKGIGKKRKDEEGMDEEK